MTDGEARNNFNRQPLNAGESGSFWTRNKMVLTLALAIVSLLVLGVQIMPYVYGGSSGHFHSSGACGWPNGCDKINSFISF